jgi:hypothetical protein
MSDPKGLPKFEIPLTLNGVTNKTWYFYWATLPQAGISATIATAKLTGGGTNGSMTFVNGVLTAQVAAT